MGLGLRWRGRIIPAYAGSTPFLAASQAVDSDHPRIRGEHRPPRVVPRRQSGIIPAYAGSTWLRYGTPREHRDHPRIRGEHSVEGYVHALLAGSSPHTRGAPAPSDPPRATWRIIPAYAGSTRPACPPCRLRLDHPRIRGEHSWPPSAASSAAGSSPHTRGAQPRGHVLVRHGRIIPAGVHRHIDAFIDVEKHFSLPWRDFHGRVDRYGGA